MKDRHRNHGVRRPGTGEGVGPGQRVTAHNRRWVYFFWSCVVAVTVGLAILFALDLNGLVRIVLVASAALIAVAGLLVIGWTAFLLRVLPAALDDLDVS